MMERMTAETPNIAPHPSDRAAIDAMAGVERVYLNHSRWWQNASFALPLLAAVATLAIGLIFGSTEALGFGIFASVVTLIMVPVVLLTWRSTSTAIALTQDGAYALHRGRVIHEVPWAELRRIEVVEYLGNKRYKLVHGEDEQFLSVESEIEEREDLVERAFALSGVPRQNPDLQV